MFCLCMVVSSVLSYALRMRLEIIHCQSSFSLKSVSQPLEMISYLDNFELMVTLSLDINAFNLISDPENVVASVQNILFLDNA